MKPLTLPAQLASDVRHTKLQLLGGKTIPFSQINPSIDMKRIGKNVTIQQNATVQTPDWI